MEIIFLTLSNLAFTLAVLLAIYRGFYLEATVFFYLMFFSTVSCNKNGWAGVSQGRECVVTDVLDTCNIRHSKPNVYVVESMLTTACCV